MFKKLLKDNPKPSHINIFWRAMLSEELTSEQLKKLAYAYEQVGYKDQALRLFNKSDGYNDFEVEK